MNIYGGGKLLNTFDRVKYRQIKDDEIKSLFGKIKLNTDFSLPDKLIQDFVNDGSIEPSFIICTEFKNKHFNKMLLNIKKKKFIKKSPPKPKSKKMKNQITSNTIIKPRKTRKKNDKNDKKIKDKMKMKQE